MIMRFFLALTFAASLAAQDDAWHAREAVTGIQFNPNALRDLGLRVVDLERTGIPFRPNYLGFAAAPDAPTFFFAPGGDFERLTAASLEHQGGFALTFGDQKISLRRFQLNMAPAPYIFELADQEGRVWFYFEYAHSYLIPGLNELRLLNMDMTIAPALAEWIGRPDLVGMYLATADTVLAVDIPEDFQPEGSCTPNFNGDVDVELSGLRSLSQFAREAGGRVALAPSAELRNVGTADVPWYRAIFPDGGGNPAIVGQHPFLVIHFYRIADGTIEQVGRSDVKHAFFSINSGCPCAGGQILYLGCGDVYGSGTNASRFYLAPRDELTASTGNWESLGSHFDATPVDDQRDHGSAGHDDFEHRLTVMEPKLQTKDAQYFFEAWYVVKDDIDIFNSMGHRETVPSLIGSTWAFAYPTGTHTAGPAIDAWVPRGIVSQMRANNLANTGEGHLQLAVSVTELPGTGYRYEYALMNLDYDRQVRELRVPILNGVSVFNASDGSRDGLDGVGWTASIGADAVVWSAPAGQGLDWGTLHQFRFDAAAGPVDVTASMTPLEIGETGIVDLASKGPGIACITGPALINAASQWPAVYDLLDLTGFVNTQCRPPAR